MKGAIIWVVLYIRVPFSVPIIVRHPYKKDPERDPNLENYPYEGSGMFRVFIEGSMYP